MILETLYKNLSKEKQLFQFGMAAKDPLADAFPCKMVVHAGLNSKPVPPKEAQKIWQEIMHQPPKSRKTEMAYIHIPFCKTKCSYCGFFQNSIRG